MELVTPLTDEVIRELHAGDEVEITGVIYAGRDGANRRLVQALERGERLPFDPEGQIIYYMGPSPARPDRPIGSAGPASAYRMDPYTPALLEIGLKGTIGKGGRGLDVREALREHRAVHFAAIGGASALIANSIKKAKVIAYEELGKADALRRLEVEAFAVIVANDIYGGDVYEEGRARYRRVQC